MRQRRLRGHSGKIVGYYLKRRLSSETGCCVFKSSRLDTVADLAVLEDSSLFKLLGFDRGC